MKVEIEEYKRIIREIPRPYKTYMEGELARLILYGRVKLEEINERKNKEIGKNKTNENYK